MTTPTDPIEHAAHLLAHGGLVAFPTETVYGLGADASNPEAVRRIFSAKGRDPGRALTVHLGPNASPEPWSRWSAPAERLAHTFWPGPLTLILPRTDHVPPIVTGGLDTVGLRVPSHPLAMELLDRFGGGVAAPSANRSGRISPTTAAHVREELGDRIDYVLDGGPCTIGIESTVLSLADTPRILRLGAIPPEELEAVLRTPIARPAIDPHAHYAPNTPTHMISSAELSAALEHTPDGTVVYGPPSLMGTLPTGIRHVSSPDDAQTYGRELYGRLRELDGLGCPRILVIDPPEGSEWETIRQRLWSAARSSVR